MKSRGAHVGDWNLRVHIAWFICYFGSPQLALYRLIAGRGRSAVTQVLREGAKWWMGWLWVLIWLDMTIFFMMGESRGILFYEVLDTISKLDSNCIVLLASLQTSVCMCVFLLNSFLIAIDIIFVISCEPAYCLHTDHTTSWQISGSRRRRKLYRACERVHWWEHPCTWCRACARAYLTSWCVSNIRMRTSHAHIRLICLHSYIITPGSAKVMHAGCECIHSKVKPRPVFYTLSSLHL